MSTRKVRKQARNIRNNKRKSGRKVKAAGFHARHIDLAQLRKRCFASIDDFRCEGTTVIETKDGPMIFQDNGSRILAVAHLDTVQSTRVFSVAEMQDGTHELWNLQLDDRLGAHIILDVLPKYGITVDVLLTDSEEVGRSTASYFDADSAGIDFSRYNWIIEFDRAGTDVAMYEYLDDEKEQLIASYGLRATHGLFTDICSMENVGVTGFNWGVGYYDNHCASSYCVLEETEEMIDRFLDFYNDNKDQRYDYVPAPTTWKDKYIYDDYRSYPDVYHGGAGYGTYDSLDSRLDDDYDRYYMYSLEVEATEEFDRMNWEQFDGTLTADVERQYIEGYIAERTAALEEERRSRAIGLDALIPNSTDDDGEYDEDEADCVSSASYDIKDYDFDMWSHDSDDGQRS